MTGHIFYTLLNVMNVIELRMLLWGCDVTFMMLCQLYKDFKGRNCLGG
jgi:hypothetical protein